MRTTVIGTGYLGAVHAACMAEIGHDVLGIDIDRDQVNALAAGRPRFFEPGLEGLLRSGLDSGRLRFSSSLAEAADFGDVHFICVGTPQLPGSLAADISGVEAVVDELGPQLKRSCLVVGKSTVPVGTASVLAARLVDIAPAGCLVDFAWNPEFLREGLAVDDTLQPDRLVVGTASARASEVLREVYAPIIDAGVPYLCTDLPTAELVKVAANAFLAMKISFINAIGDLCEAAGADVVALTQALGYDHRIGAGSMTAGLGFGGGCLPKDLRALLARGDELGVSESLRFLRGVDAVNMQRRERVVNIATEVLGGSLSGREVGVLGASFKPHTDDVRDSPALAVAVAMHLSGAQVRVHDPAAIENARSLFPELKYMASAEDACANAEIVLHLTEWPQYRDLDPVALRAKVRRAYLLDARNSLPVDNWVAASWTVRRIGTGSRRHPYDMRIADRTNN